MNILIVDDDASIRKLVSVALTQDGHDISEAENGEVGVDMAKSALPDLIIMDLNMPVMDGFKAIAEMKSTPEALHIPILVLTGEDAPANYDEIYRAGADGYIPKPVDLLRLVERVRTMAASEL